MTRWPWPPGQPIAVYGVKDVAITLDVQGHMWRCYLKGTGSWRDKVHHLDACSMIMYIASIIYLEMFSLLGFSKKCMIA